VENEYCDIHKLQIQSNEDEKHMKDPAINTILFLELYMINKYVSNNCKSEGFGMQRSEDYLLRVSAEKQRYSPSHQGYSHNHHIC
jgi:hypothetical protein